MYLLVADLGSAQVRDTEPISEIRVTGRPAANYTDVSSALTELDVDEIRGNVLVTDAVSGQAGVFLQQTTPGQGAAIVRGLKGSDVLHLVDGLRLNNAIFRSAPTQYLALVAPGTVESVEIVRGPKSSLYGSDAVGGVVQVLSHVPSFDQAGSRGEVYASAGSAEQLKSLRTRYEAGNERVAGLISAEYFELGNRRIGGGERVVPSGYEGRSGRLALSVTPAAGRNWLFDFQTSEQPSTPRVDELVPGFGQTEPSSSEFWFAPNERRFAHLSHSRSDWLLSADWNFDLGWQQIVDDRTTRDFGGDTRWREDNSSDLYGATMNASRNTAGGSWVAGLELYHDKVRSSRLGQDLLSGSESFADARFPDGSAVDSAAIYGTIEHWLNDRHLVSGGLRFSSIDVDLAATRLTASSNLNEAEFSGDIGWVFNLSETTQLVANFGRGFRAPNIFDLGTLGERPGNRFNIPNPNLASERVSQLDFGIRKSGESVQLDFVVYALRYSNRIGSELTGQVTESGRDIVQSQNVSSSDMDGLESAAQFVIDDDVTLGLVLNYTHGSQIEPDGSRVPGDRIPPLNGRLWLELSPRSSIVIEPYLLFATKQDRLSPRDVGDSRIDPTGTSAWVTLNVRANWSVNTRWQLTATLENLLDESYRWHGSGIDAVGRNAQLSLFWRSP